MIRPVIVALVVTVGATSVYAASAAIEMRQKAMKAMGGATRAPGGMLKGEVPFDLSKVQETLKVYADTAKRMPELFPDDSKTGDKTEALPEIWTKRAEFDAHIAKFAADSENAMKSITDEASFKATMPKVLGNCGSCHQQFRAKT